MKRTASLLAIAGMTLLASCSSDSSLPNPTGKGTIRAINAIKHSPGVDFRIEERLLENIPYKSISAGARYDDLDYTFNFDVRFAGESDDTRIASQFIDVSADQDYTLLLSGTLANAVVTLWEMPERTFADGATVFQVRFAHAANTLGAVDYYFSTDGAIPASGEQVASLSFGEISSAMDFESGDYVFTMTSAGNPADILYQSDSVTVAAQANTIIAPFDGDANDVSPVVVRSLGAQGGEAAFPDSSFPATVEFLHVAVGLGTSDIYDDESLTSLVTSNNDYGDLSSEIPIAAGTTTFRYTPAGDTSMVSLEGDLTAIAGRRYRFVASGDDSEFTTGFFLPERSAIDSAVRVNLAQASNNFEFLDIYAVPAGETIEDEAPVISRLGSSTFGAFITLSAGARDFYVTEFGESAILAGPLQRDAQLGDVVDLVIFDTTDPAVLQIRDYSVP